MKKIIIIGAGISGLFFANLLRQNSNYNVSIFEKKKSINLEHGYGIQLSTNSVKLLNEIGFKNLDSLTTFNPKNLDFYSLKEKKKICDLNISQFNTKDVKYTTLQRSTLIEFLEGRLKENIIKYGQVIKQVVKQKEMIKLTMEDNSMVLCDYLIICDGVFSSTKPLIANKITKNKYFNSIALRGTINKKNFNSIDSKNISLFMGSIAKTLILSSG